MIVNNKNRKSALLIKKIGCTISAFVVSIYEGNISKRLDEFLLHEFKCSYSIAKVENWIKNDNFPSYQSISLNGIEQDDLEGEKQMLLENEKYIKDSIMSI